MSIFSIMNRKGPTGFGYAATAESVTNGISLTGKTFLVTGCNSGLGLETTRVLALRGAHVIGTARTSERAKEAAAAVQGKVTGLACELEDPVSITACIAAIKAMGQPLDAIITNAGIMALPKLELVHGIERQFFTNHIGHFILVTGLLDQLAHAGRVVVLSSEGHKMAPEGGIDFDNLDGSKSYKPWTFYGQSKMANLIFAKELARRFAGTRKTAYAVHPGVIRTNLGRSMNFAARLGMGIIAPVLFKNIPQGAATSCFCATNPAAPALSGGYFADCNIAPSRTEANNADLAARLWEVSETIVAANKRP